MAGTGDKLLTAAEIKEVTDTKVNISDIVNALNSTSTNKPLSAAQGKVLNDAIAQSMAYGPLNMTGVSGRYAIAGKIVVLTLSLVLVSMALDVEVDLGVLQYPNVSPIWGQFNGNGRTYNIRVNDGHLYCTYKGGAGLPDSGKPSLLFSIVYITT